MRHLRAWLCFWVALFWFWFLLVGEWNRIELIAAACAASVAATVGEVARTKANVAATVPLRALASLPRVVPQIFIDFGLLVVALLRGVRGRTLRRAFHAVDDEPAAVGLRAYTLWLATISPNAIAIDIDREHEQTVLHDVIESRASERPA